MKHQPFVRCGWTPIVPEVFDHTTNQRSGLLQYGPAKRHTIVIYPALMLQKSGLVWGAVSAYFELISSSRTAADTWILTNSYTKFQSNFRTEWEISWGGEVNKEVWHLKLSVGTGLVISSSLSWFCWQAFLFSCHTHGPLKSLDCSTRFIILSFDEACSAGKRCSYR